MQNVHFNGPPDVRPLFLTLQAQAAAKKEIFIHKQLQHSHIIKLEEVKVQIVGCIFKLSNSLSIVNGNNVDT